MKTENTELYMLDDHGKLFRAGEQIGTLNDKDEIVLAPDSKKYQAAVTRWLREQADQQEAAEKERKDKPDAENETPPVAKKKGNDADEEELAALTSEAKKEGEKSRTAYKDDVDFANQTGCPQPPKKNPQFGDKTPAYVDWLHKHRPDVWKQRFGVKGKGKVPVIRANADGIDEVVGYRDADMASRKTHLTEKIETNRGLGEDMDWEA